MRDYYEDLWSRLPAELTPPDLARRRAFLLSELHAGDRVLDVGCGDGTFSSLLATAGAGSVVGVDVAETALLRARATCPELSFERVDPDGTLPFADNRFQLVWAGEVLEHIADTARWLSEVRRVLVPGGRLVLSTPDHGRVRLLVGGIARYSPPLGDHLHLYTRSSLRDLLCDFGFAGVVIRAEGGFIGMRRLLLARAAR